MTERNHIDIKEFREEGFLQEANRLFFHPHGLALEVITHEDGTEELGGIWDYREDPEGIIYGPGMIDPKKCNRVKEEFKKHLEARQKLFFGSWIQPDS